MDAVKNGANYYCVQRFHLLCSSIEPAVWTIGPGSKYKMRRAWFSPLDQLSTSSVKIAIIYNEQHIKLTLYWKHVAYLALLDLVHQKFRALLPEFHHIFPLPSLQPLCPSNTHAKINVHDFWSNLEIVIDFWSCNDRTQKSLNYRSPLMIHRPNCLSPTKNHRKFIQMIMHSKWGICFCFDPLLAKKKKKYSTVQWTQVLGSTFHYIQTSYFIGNNFYFISFSAIL